MFTVHICCFSCFSFHFCWADVKLEQRTGCSVTTPLLRYANIPCRVCLRDTLITFVCVPSTRVALADPPEYLSPLPLWTPQSLRDFIVSKNVFIRLCLFTRFCVNNAPYVLVFVSTATKLGGRLDVVTYYDDLEGTV